TFHVGASSSSRTPSLVCHSSKRTPPVRPSSGRRSPGEAGDVGSADDARGDVPDGFASVGRCCVRGGAGGSGGIGGSGAENEGAVSRPNGDIVPGVDCGIASARAPNG